MGDVSSVVRDGMYARRGYVLFVLCATYALTALDTTVFAILLQPIKREFDLSDSQLGFLSGISFALFDVAFVVPLGRLADVWKRTSVIAISIALFGAMTSLCGFAGNIWQLAAVRSACAVGAAGTVPSSTSIIADLYPERSRGTAMALFVIGGFSGGFLAFAVGGLVAEKFGWRVTLQLVAIPSVLLGLIIYLTVKEPRRGLADGDLDPGNDDPMPLRMVLKFLWGQRSLRHLTAGATLVYFFAYSLVTWMPSYLERSYGMGIAETGLILGGPLGALSVLGMMAAGALGDRIGRRDVRWRVWIVSIALGIAFPFCVATFLAPSKAVAIGAYTVPAALNAVYVSPTFALVQGLVSPRMRSIALAILLAVLTIVGMGMGPQVVGVLSDILRLHFGADSLRFALLFTTPVLFWAAVHFYWAATYLPGDMARVKSEMSEVGISISQTVRQREGGRR